MPMSALRQFKSFKTGRLKQKIKKLDNQVFKSSSLTSLSFHGYTFQEQIGEGGCAYVYLASKADNPSIKKSEDSNDKKQKDHPEVDCNSNSHQNHVGMSWNPELVAAKVSKRPSYYQCQRERQSWLTEIDILTSVRHQNIIKCFESFHASHFVVVITEYVDGKDLFDVIAECDSISVNARSIACQILEALDCLHNKYSVAHMDLKVENVIVSVSGVAKLCDFGSAVRIPSDGMIGTKGIATPSVLPPEYIQQDFCDAKACDMWSYGVILYLLLFQRYPYGQDIPVVITNAQYKKKLDFSGVDEKLFKDLMQLIRQCLNTDPASRINVSNALKSNFFKIK